MNLAYRDGFIKACADRGVTGDDLLKTAGMSPALAEKLKVLGIHTGGVALAAGVGAGSMLGGHALTQKVYKDYWRKKHPLLARLGIWQLPSLDALGGKK